MLKNKQRYCLVILLILYLILGVIVITHRFGLDPDMLWHIKIGNDIISNQTVSIDNNYTWLSGSTWNQQEWFYDVIISTLIKYFGVWGYYLPYGLGCILLFYLSYTLSKPKNIFMHVIIFSIVMACVPLNVMNRPAEYSVFIFILFMCLYYKRGNKYHLLYLLAGIFIGNFHCGMGIILTAFFVMQIILDIILSFCNKNIQVKNDIKHSGLKVLDLLLFIVGMCINPFGFGQIINMIKAIGIQSNQFINEWKALSIDNLGYILLLMFLVGALIYNIKCWNKIDLFKIVCILAVFALMCKSQKSSIIFVYLYVCFGYKYVEQFIFDIADYVYKGDKWEICRVKLNKGICVGVTLCVFIISGFILNQQMGYNFNNYVDNMCRGVISDNMIMYLQESDAKLLNGYDTGNYLLWNDIKVFVDTRQHPYVQEFGELTAVDDMFDMSNTKNKRVMDAYFDKYDFDIVLSDKISFDVDWYMQQRTDFKRLGGTNWASLWVKI